MRQILIGAVAAAWASLAISVAAQTRGTNPAAPKHTRGSARPALAVLLSLDGLSWSRLELYRPYYVAGLKRLLDEGQVEAGARYLHLNTETSPGHAALATAPLRASPAS